MDEIHEEPREIQIPVSGRLVSIPVAVLLAAVEKAFRESKMLAHPLDVGEGVSIDTAYHPEGIGLPTLVISMKLSISIRANA